MHMTIPLKVLQAGLKTLAPATKGRTPLPVLKHVLIQDGTLTCTDLDLRIEHRLPELERQLDHDQAAGCTVDYKTLADWVALVKQDVTLRLQGDQLLATSGKSRTVLPTLPAEEFPLATWEGETTYEFPDGLLQQVLRRVQFARAQAEETRAVMTGVLFQFGPDALTLVGTDGLRLCYQGIPGQHERVDYVLSGADNILTLPEGDLTLTIGRSSWAVQAGPTRLGARLLEGVFPQWEKVCSFKAPQVVTLNRVELCEALRRVLLFCQDKQSPHLLRLDFADGVLRISGETAQFGSGVEEIHTGWDCTVTAAYNGKFLLEGLSHLDTPTIDWGFQDNAAEKASRVRVGEWNYVMMPVRLREAVYA